MACGDGVGRSVGNWVQRGGEDCGEEEEKNGKEERRGSCGAHDEVKERRECS